MKKKIGLVVLGLALAGGLGACSTKYGIPDGGPHYKSWDHARYSIGHWWEGEKERPPLTKAEYEKAKVEKWHGIPIEYKENELK